MNNGMKPKYAEGFLYASNNVFLELNFNNMNRLLHAGMRPKYAEVFFYFPSDTALFKLRL